jgi:hypothetical protein
MQASYPKNPPDRPCSSSYMRSRGFFLWVFGAARQQAATHSGRQVMPMGRIGCRVDGCQAATDVSLEFAQKRKGRFLWLLN